MDSVPEVIEVEAEAEEDVKVPGEIVQFDMAAIHGDGWSRPEDTADQSDPLMLSLVQWLGAEAVHRMKAVEIEALRRGVSKLPEPEGEESFVWEAIRGPTDISCLADAIVGYRRFDISSIQVAEAMGANAHFRRAIRQARVPATSKLADFLVRESKAVDNVKALIASIDTLSSAMRVLFGERDFTVAAALVAVGASEGMKAGMQRMNGFLLSRPARDDELDVLDGMRRKVVAASEAVRKACSVVPLLYSRGVLSGVRRSISERQAGDFVFAVEAIGGSIPDQERMTDAGRSFAAYFAAADSFTEAVAEMGFSREDEPHLVSHLSARRHLRSAARGLGIDWAEVAPLLQIEADGKVTGDDLRELVNVIGQQGVSGRLKAVCKDFARALADVREAGYRLTVQREYWIEAGRRVLAIRPDATLHDIRQVMEIEPAIAGSKEVLREYGVTSRADVDPLERHLEWMISAYALPIPDEAVERIIETRAGIIPLRMSAA